MYRRNLLLMVGGLNFFPDLSLFLASGTAAMRKASFEELDKPKRYRLKKILNNVTSSLHLRGKK